MNLNIFAGKSPTERNKIIAATVLGIMALVSLFLAFGGSFFGSKKATVTVTTSTSPSPNATVNSSNASPITKPDDATILRDWSSTPVVYNRFDYSAPDAGRNIFAFYEPPPPTPYSPTPYVATPEKTPVPPTPTPTPPIMITFYNPQSVYAGSKTFRLQLNGEGFTSDSQILFNGSALPTVFTSANQISADIPANLILGEGPRQISVATPNGEKYSNQVLLNVQAPPRPQFQYYGIVARKRNNNDTAYIKEQGKQDVRSARLNDVIENRFRLISIAKQELIVEDTSLGFRHKVPLVGDTTAGNTGGSNNDILNRGGGGRIPQPATQACPPYCNPQTFPNVDPNNSIPQNIPGIPNDIPRANPPQNQKRDDIKQQDFDVDDGDN